MSSRKNYSSQIKNLELENQSLRDQINRDQINFEIKWGEKALWFILGCLTFLTGFSIVWANRDSRNNICSNTDN